LIRLAPVLIFIVSVAALVVGPRAESADQGKKASPVPKVSTAPAKPSPAASVAPSAAAPAPAQVSEQEKALRERVNAYWKNRSASNLHACYPFYEASFRNQYTPDKFATDFRRLSRFAPEFLGIDAVSIDPSGAKATLKVKLRTHPDVLQGQELISSVEEAWVLEGGVWSKTGELTFPNI
jgi:hypothetical protein